MHKDSQDGFSRESGASGGRRNKDHMARGGNEAEKVENNDEGYLREVTRQLRGRAMFQHRSNARRPSKDVSRVDRHQGGLNNVQDNLGRAKITITHCLRT